MAGGHFGGRDTCESCKSIDVRHWYREGRLADGQYFTWSWTCLGETSGTIEVRTECDAAVLRYRARGFLAAEWKSIEQRVPITWTNCHLGGRRPWFVCSVRANGRYCGRRVATRAVKPLPLTQRPRRVPQAHVQKTAPSGVRSR